MLHRMINLRYKDDPKASRRWVPASWVTTQQLNEYWSNFNIAAYIASTSPSRDLESTKCRTHKEQASHKFGRPGKGGWLYACTPDGYIVHLKEYAGVESIPQRYFFLAEIVEEDENGEIVVVVHDDACHLKKYCLNRCGEGEFAKKLSLLFFIIDRLHAKGHVDDWCEANCHPDAECNVPHVAGLNTSVCEQQFSSLSRHKFVIRSMQPLNSALLLIETAESRNIDLLEKHEKAL